MRNILLILLALIFIKCSDKTKSTATTYDPARHTPINKAFGVAQANPIDARSYYYDATLFKYRPYQSVAEVNAYLNQTKFRQGSFSVFINVGGVLNSDGTFTGGLLCEYSYRNGTNDGDLVSKDNLVDVRWFGAKGLGVSSLSADTTAFRAAFKYLKQVGGGRLYVPTSPKFYAFSGAQYVIPDNCEIFGDGKGKSIIRNVQPTTQKVVPGAIFLMSTFGATNGQGLFQSGLTNYKYTIKDANKGDTYVVLTDITKASALYVGEVIAYGANIFAHGNDSSRLRYANCEQNRISKINRDSIFFDNQIAVPLKKDASNTLPVLINLNNNNQPATAFGSDVVLHTTQNVYIHDLTIQQAQRDEVADTSISLRLSGIFQPGGGYNCTFSNIQIDAYNGIVGNLWAHCEFAYIDIYEERHMLDFGFDSYDIDVHDINYFFKNSDASDFSASLLILNDCCHKIKVYNVSASGDRSDNNICLLDNVWDIDLYNFNIDLPNYRSNNSIFLISGDSSFASYNINAHDWKVRVDSVGVFLRISQSDTIGLATKNRNISVYNFDVIGNKIYTVWDYGLNVVRANGVKLKNISIPQGRVIFEDCYNCNFQNIYAPTSRLTFKGKTTGSDFSYLTVATNDSSFVPATSPNYIGAQMWYNGSIKSNTASNASYSGIIPYTGTFSNWVGTTPPTGADSWTLQYTKNTDTKQVNVWFSFSFTTGGVAITSVEFSWPPELPIPVEPPSVTTAGSIVYSGVSNLAASGVIDLVGKFTMIKAGSGVYKFRATSTSSTAKTFSGTISYIYK